MSVPVRSCINTLIWHKVFGNAENPLMECAMDGEAIMTFNLSPTRLSMKTYFKYSFQ